MDERSSMIVTTLEELENNLKKYLEGEQNIQEFYHGKRTKEWLTTHAKDEGLTKTIETWVTERNYTKLLELWVKGLSFDWQVIYKNLTPEQKPRRISAPTYPFAKERYWWLNSASNDEATTSSSTEVYDEAWEFILSNDQTKFSDQDMNVEHKAILFIQNLIADELQISFKEIPLDESLLILG